jgi:hypothetical protein
VPFLKERRRKNIEEDKIGDTCCKNGDVRNAYTIL